jgi:ABC-type branched-subunit amino acid transport system permease subunit
MNNKIKLGGLLALLMLLLVLPLFFSDPTFYSIAIFTLLYASSVTGWNIFSGYTGYVSLGYTAFTGVGGYTLAMICDHWQLVGGYIPFLLVPVAGLVAAIFALPMGWVALRTRRVTFVVVTIALFFILQSLALNLSNFTGGSSGILLPASEWTGDFYNIPYYYVSLALLVLAVIIAWWIRNSKYGLGLLAIRDDEDRASGLGVKTWAFKLSAYVISAFLGGMAGAVMAYYSGTIFPVSAFDPSINVAVALMAFLGGVGTLAGPVLGAFLLEPFQKYLTIQYGSLSLNLVILGVLLLAVILVMPEGILITFPKLWQKRNATRAAAAPSPVPEQEKVVLIESNAGESK